MRMRCAPRGGVVLPRPAPIVHVHTRLLGVSHVGPSHESDLQLKQMAAVYKAWRLLYPAVCGPALMLRAAAHGVPCSAIGAATIHWTIGPAGQSLHTSPAAACSSIQPQHEEQQQQQPGDLRQQLLVEAMKHVPALGWSPAALVAAARSLGLSPAVTGLLPRCVGAVIACGVNCLRVLPRRIG